MGVAFYKGQQLGPEDLNIDLENNSGVPVNAAEIYYSVSDVTLGAEVVVGAPRRSPANPQIGKYYASLIVPLDANLGLYRIRWSFRETIGGTIHQVVQEFEVIDKEVVTVGVSATELDLVRRLRILLRDNCVGGEELVQLDVAGKLVTMTMAEVWEALHDLSPPAP